jgi:hypothetical protein
VAVLPNRSKPVEEYRKSVLVSEPRFREDRTMRALSLTQPWASAIAMGLKRYETRSWSTRLRGDVCIHAAKGFPRFAQEFFEDQMQEGLLLPDSDLPRGAIIAVAEVTACLRTEEVFPTIERVERMYGNYEAGRFAFRLENIRVLSQPIFCRGALSFWSVGWEEAKEVMRRIDRPQMSKFGEAHSGVSTDEQLGWGPATCQG